MSGGAIRLEGKAFQHQMEFAEIEGENFKMMHTIPGVPIRGRVSVTIAVIPDCETCYDDGWIMVPTPGNPELPDQAPCPDCPATTTQPPENGGEDG